MCDSSGPLAELVDAVDSKSTGRKAIPVRFRGGPLALLLACIVGVGCAKAAPPAAPAQRDCSDGAIKVLSDLMDCRMAPWQKGKIPDSEVRKAFIRIREFAPVMEWNDGTAGWSHLVDDALATGNYGAACNQCHRAHLKDYKSQPEFRARLLPSAIP
jgi:hypothetical protein